MSLLAPYAGAERRRAAPRKGALTQAMARMRAGVIVETAFQLAAREAQKPVDALRRPKTKVIAPWRFAALWLAAEAGVSRCQIALHSGMDRTAIAHGIKQCRARQEEGGDYYLSCDALRGEILALFAPPKVA